MEIQNLHPEIIFLICESICPHCQKLDDDWPKGSPTGEKAPRPAAKERRQTIFNLSFVCKNWGSIAQKVLHHHFGAFETHPKAEFLLCRTLSENPELGNHVKDARITHISSYDWSLNGEWLANSLNKFSEVLDFPGTTVPDTSEWGEFIAPLILLQVPNLDRLLVQDKHFTEIVKKFRRPFLREQSVLPRRIKTIFVKPPPIISESSTDGSLDLSEASVGGFLSAIQSLGDLTLYRPNPQSLRDRLNLISLRSLALSDTFLSRGELQLLLSATGPLEEFRYNGVYRPDLDAVTPQDICELLIPKKHTLAQLHLETPYTAQYFTAGKHLANVSYMRFLLTGIWLPTDAEPILDERALLDIFPPKLSQIWLDVSEIAFPGSVDALVTYILSTCRDHPEDQVLRRVYLRVLTAAERGDPEFPMEIHRSAWEAIKQRCEPFLRNGKIIMLLTSCKTGRGKLISW